MFFRRLPEQPSVNSRALPAMPTSSLPGIEFLVLLGGMTTRLKDSKTLAAIFRCTQGDWRAALLMVKQSRLKRATFMVVG